MKLFYPVIFAFASKTLQLLFVRRRLWWPLLVWFCCSLFCAINTPAFPGLFVLIFLWAVLKKVKMLLFEVFRSYSWQGMGFVPASICCLEPFPVRRPDPGAPSSQRGAERHLRTETSATCAWLQGHSSACSGTCAWSSVWNKKNPFPMKWSYQSAWGILGGCAQLRYLCSQTPLPYLWVFYGSCGFFFSLPS